MAVLRRKMRRGAAFMGKINIVTIIFNMITIAFMDLKYLKSASNLNGNLNCSKELEHYAS